MENIIKLTEPVWAVVTNKIKYIEGVGEGAQLMTERRPVPRTTPGRTWNSLYDKKGAGHWATRDPRAAPRRGARVGPGRRRGTVARICPRVRP